MSTDRNEYTAGLRALADLLDTHPDLPLPYAGRSADSPLNFIDSGTDDYERAQARTFTRLIPGRIDKEINESGYVRLTGAIHGLHVQMIVNRSAVCTRVVTGVREVTREVPDPEALAAVPTTTVTETVEDVQWECGPLLADRSEVSA